MADEHVIAENRLKAKQRFEEQERSRAREAARKHLHSDDVGGSSKRQKGSDSNPPPKDQRLKSMIGPYVEYDLATLQNSRGGFLVESEESDPRLLKEQRIIEENKRKRLENLRKRGLLTEGGVTVAEDTACRECGAREVDTEFEYVFHVPVCWKCKAAFPDKYSLLTKTEAREDYLLTEPELRDEELLPHLLKPNPHRPTYSNMMLYLRCQVEDYAFSPKKWGSAEALDAEFERRQETKNTKKQSKFEEKLKELRTKTKTNIWHKRVENQHVHAFAEEVTTNSKGESVQRCTECGFEIEVEVF